MNEKDLSFLCLFCTFLGLLGLIIISSFLPHHLTAIQDIDKNILGNTIRIQGVVSSFKEVQDMFILEVTDDTGTAAVIFFSSETPQLKKDSFVEILGTVIIYDCILEIRAEKITLLSI